MRVAVAGSTGAVGVPLVRRLREAGHEVVELSRRTGCDVLDKESVRAALAGAPPDAVVQQLTALPSTYGKKEMARGLEQTNRLRTEGTRNLLAAAPGARLVCQSICFAYRPKERLHVEDDDLWTDGPDPLPSNTAALLEMERTTVEAGGVVLRYGHFYGPGTWYTREGSFGKMLRRRGLPVIGGRGVFSFCHVEDAAAAVLPALERGHGIYNVCDDDPAPTREWLPALAEAVGAPSPVRLPAAAGRLVSGYVTAMYDRFQGSSNARVRQDLGWEPEFPGWRGHLGAG